MAFLLSKILWVFTAPGNLLVLLLVVGAFWIVSRDKKRQARGRELVIGVAFIFFTLAVFPVDDWLLTPIENRFPAAHPDKVDGIVLIGGDENALASTERGQPVMLASARRYVAFAALARQYPEAKLVFSGGSARLRTEDSKKEADVATEALTSLGIAPERLVVEEESRNTRENAVASALIVQPKPEETWLLVTSAFHMPRAMGCFRKAGWNVQPATTDYRTDGHYAYQVHFDLTEHLYKITLAVHEYVGLVAYYLLGYTDSLWPG